MLAIQRLYKMKIELVLTEGLNIFLFFYYIGKILKIQLFKLSKMQNLQFPIRFVFKIGTFSNDFTATDANGNTVAYVRQKLFKFKEAVSVYKDESRTQVNYKINADRWLDFSAAYSFHDAQDNYIGKVARKGWRSIWKASYDIIDQHDQLQYKVKEKNPWVKVWDSLLGEIPILGVLTGYFFNPSYAVIDLQQNEIAVLKKNSSFFGRRFTIDKTGMMDSDDDDRILLSLMMMVLLERRRG